MNVNLQHIVEWLRGLQQVYAENKEFLTDLDSAIGDADHGVNMDRGFTAAIQTLNQSPPADIAAAFKMVSTDLIRTVGGASGPLYGTFFLRASTASKGKNELNVDDVIAVFESGLEGVLQRGKAQVNDKTMVDVLSPVLQAMKDARQQGADMAAMLAQAVNVAEIGMKNTIPLQARKGRASYLGERSIGHQDPGATSSYLLIQKAAEIWGK